MKLLKNSVLLIKLELELEFASCEPTTDTVNIFQSSR